MNAVATYTIKERTAHKAAIAYLKDRIKTVAARQRHNKNVLRASGGLLPNSDILKMLDRALVDYPDFVTPERPFIGINDGAVAHYSKEYWEQSLTVLHIVYNRLRNRPPHTGSVSRLATNDDFYLSGQNHELHHATQIYEDLFHRILRDYGTAAVKEVD